jgi:hypothetical protein
MNKYCALLFLFLISCGGGGSDDSESFTSTSCGDFTVDTSDSEEIVSVATEEGVEGAEDLGLDLSKVEDSTVIVVGCGGTFIDNDPVTTTTVTTSETNNNDETSLLRGFRDGSITSVRLF